MRTTVQPREVSTAELIRRVALRLCGTFTAQQIAEKVEAEHDRPCTVYEARRSLLRDARIEVVRPGHYRVRWVQLELPLGLTASGGGSTPM